MMVHARGCILLIAAVVLAATATSATAQNSPPNALQGFSQNRDQPVKIDAATLEVRDKDKVATFSGNVHLVQGDTTMRCKTLVVFYEQDQGGATTGAMKSATPVGPGGGSQSIKRLEAKGDVIVIQKDQKATGELGIFDMKANTVTLHNNVLISQGTNVVKGDRLVVNLTTGVSRVECNTNSQTCRVSAIINPNSGKPEGATGTTAPGAAGPGGGAQPHGRNAPAPRPAGPSGVY